MEENKNILQETENEDVLEETDQIDQNEATPSNVDVDQDTSDDNASDENASDEDESDENTSDEDASDETVPDESSEPEPEEISETEDSEAAPDDADDPFMGEDEAVPKKKKSKLPLRITIGILIALAVAYGVGCVFYSGHFYGNTIYHGTWIGNQDAGSAVKTLTAEAENYTLTLIKNDDSKVVIKGQDIDFEFKDQTGVEQALAGQSVFDWPAHIFGETVYDISENYAYDKDKLTKQLEPVFTVAEDQQSVTANPTPVYKDGKVTIQKEVYGNVPDTAMTNELITKAVASGDQELNLKTAGCYGTPKYKSTDKAVKKAKTELEGKLGASITYTIDSSKEVVDATVYGPWYKTDENMKLYLDTKDVEAYLAALAEKYDTIGGPYNFVTSYGTSITLNDGNYGWYIDEDAELPQLVANIENGDVVTREPASNSTGGSMDSKTISGTYVEVSIDNQTMWLYVDGSCVISTPVVTGCVSSGHSTPTGVYYIHYHERDTSLSGRNDDGSEYNSPVAYWMPVNGGIGIHDADGWRSSYGGSIYLYDGSHGCINTPRSACGVIYENTSDGCPVVIY